MTKPGQQRPNFLVATKPRAFRALSRQGRLALLLISITALCFLDQHLNAVDYVRPSWLMVLGFSFPIGWVAHWLGAKAIAIVGLESTMLGDLCVFVCGAAGTAINIYLWVAFLFLPFGGLGSASQDTAGGCGEADFKRLLHEHRKQGAEAGTVPNPGPAASAVDSSGAEGRDR